MSEATVAPNIDKSLDVEVDLLSEIALYLAGLVDGLADAVYLFIGEILDLYIRVNTRLLQYSSAHRRAYAINIA